MNRGRRYHLTLHVSDHLYDGLEGVLALALLSILLHYHPALPAPETLLDLERDLQTLSSRTRVPVTL